MATKLHNLIGFHLQATDGTIGMVKDFYFDCKSWKLRYLVADTGTWLPGRKVIIAPQSLGMPDIVENLIPVNLTREQIRSSPRLEEGIPVTRQYVADIHQYYQWPISAGEYPFPDERPGPPDTCRSETAGESEKYLRSAVEVTKYNILAQDGFIGYTVDMIVDDTWTIRYLIVDTNKWLPGGKVLISPSWIRDINFDRKYMEVEVTRRQVRESPGYKPAEPLDREYEEKLFEHYGITPDPERAAR